MAAQAKVSAWIDDSVRCAAARNSACTKSTSTSAAAGRAEHPSQSKSAAVAASINAGTPP